jgi:hypothetical protein
LIEGADHIDFNLRALMEQLTLDTNHPKMAMERREI